jgi:very-short-patch-repair endonuclease
MTTSHNPRRVRGVTETGDRHLPEFRGNLTPQERVLWEALRGRKLDGAKFRRPHPLGAFVLDFYCSGLRLIVELDGNIHDDSTRKARDARRDAHLITHGNHVVRIINMEVVLDLQTVLARLSAVIADLRRAVALTPDPPPKIGRGEIAPTLVAQGDM